MAYTITGDLSFSGGNSARNSAQTAIAAALTNAGAVAWAGGTYAANLTRTGTGALTVSYEVASEAVADQLKDDLLAAIASFPRSSGHLAVSRGPE